MRIYLFLAAIWLLVALMAFLYAGPQWAILDTDWSIGWILLVFAVWNVVRWWTTLPASQWRKPVENDDRVTK